MHLYQQRWMHYLFIIGAAVSLAVILHLAQWPWSKSLDDTARDVYFRVRGATPAAEVAERLPHTRDIILIETNRPLPRPLMAELIMHLRLAKVVAVDLMFVNRENELATEEKPFFTDYQKAWREEDRVLAEAVRAAGNVVLGTWVEEERIAGVKAGQYSIRRIWEKPSDLLWDSASYHGHVYMPPAEHDGIVREVRLFEETPQKTPALGLAMAAAASGVSPDQLQSRIPMRPDGTMLINFLGGRECFDDGAKRIMYSRALHLYEPGDFRDKIIIIGESSIKSKEIALTPFGEMPGMHVHAHVAATLLDPSGPPRELPLWSTLMLALITSTSLFAPLLRWPLWSSFVVAVAQVFLIILLGVALLAAGHYILPAAVPLLALMMALPGLALYEYGRTRETLGRFIGREMVPQALHSFSRLRLGGHEEEATALFCDMRHFMSLNEKMPSGAVAKLINEYTSTLSRVVRRHGGRPIDFQGDGAFMLFEYSRCGEGHALQATRAAIEFYEEFQELRQKWHRQDWPLLDIGIGIASGSMTIGLVGAEDHLKPGAVGDIVNIAARVQSLGLQCGYTILLTEAAYTSLGGEIEATGCGDFTLHGRTQPVELYGIDCSKIERDALEAVPLQAVPTKAVH